MDIAIGTLGSPHSFFCLSLFIFFLFLLVLHYSSWLSCFFSVLQITQIP